MLHSDLSRAPFQKGIWKDKQVLILGLGQYPKGSGVSAALLFARLGARVTVTDLKKEQEMKDNVQRIRKFKNVRFVLGRHDLQDVRNAEFIVPNQRVRSNSPEIKLARKLGKPIQTEMALFLNRCPAKVIGITGTRGKSTTTALIAHLLKGYRKGKVWLGGNILISPLTFLSKIKKNDLVVLELSSFQTESLSGVRAVDIAVITNLMRDHLNAYGDMEEYAEAKAQIFRHQSPKQVVILNADDAYGKQWAQEAPSRVITFGRAELGKSGPVGALLSSARFPLVGEHNRMNALAAILAAKTAGVSIDQIKRNLQTFKPLPNRLETIRIWNKIRFVNDTTATTPDGTIAAINALRTDHKTLWIIVGGADKELDYAGLGKIIARKPSQIQLLLLPGDASKKLQKAVQKTGVRIHSITDVRDGVKQGSQMAKAGDAVILSPGAASFNQFKNEFERGEVFVKAVKGLK